MYENKKSTRKVVALLVALMLIVGCVIGGTMAWLITKTDTVTNTFTVGNIEISLDETGATVPEGGTNKSQSFKMVPGAEIDKDPTITVKGGSEDCWLFVKIEENATVGQFLSYGIDTAVWGTNVVEAGVYGIHVDANAEDQTFNILANKKVTVRPDVEKADMDALNAGTVLNPELIFTAYAIQSESLKDASNTAVTDAEDAWALVKAEYSGS